MHQEQHADEGCGQIRLHHGLLHLVQLDHLLLRHLITQDVKQERMQCLSAATAAAAAAASDNKSYT
jgi:hypothetical protein